MAGVSDHKTLNCPLCFKTFTTPRALPCFHTFCEECLGSYIESQVGLKGVSSFSCPLCATKTVPSKSDLAVDKWASTFPPNTLVCSLMELSLDSDNGEVTCEPCNVGGENKIAKFWCADCQEKLCNFCSILHKRSKLFKNHTIVSVDEMGKYKQCNINFDLDCGRHGNKLKLFCIDHRELCCAVCVDTDHHECHDVRTIDGVTRDLLQRSTSDHSRIISDFRKLKTEMEKIMIEKKSNATQVMQEKDQILYDMDNRIDRIINHLNKLRNTFKEETERLYQDTEKSLLEKEKTLRSFITNVGNFTQILEVVENTGKLKEKFTIFEKIRSQIVSHYDQLKSKLTDDVEVHFTMKSNKLLDDVEETLKSLGSADATFITSVKSRDALQNTNSILKNLNSRTKISTEMCAAQVEKVEDLMTSPILLGNAVTRLQLGGGTWFTGGIYLGNGRLVMCDYTNRRLVELDDEYNIVKEYKIECKPTDVAAGNEDNEIYIAVYGDYICKCTLHTDMTIVSRIKAPSGIRSIAVSGDNIIVGTPDAVVILTQDGSTVRSIPKSGYNTYVAVSQKQVKIYHTDNNDLVCRTWEGQEVFRYQHQQLEYPCGICTDKYNNVYICGLSSHNVHQVSHDGQRSRIVQLHNISEPCSVIFHPRKKQLIVTSWEEKTVCEIYKFAKISY